MFTLNFIFLLKLTLQCVDNKRLSAGDDGTMWFCFLWWLCCGKCYTLLFEGISVL